MNYTIAHIANKLKAAREAKGLSQRTLSKLAGVPQSHISKIENGFVDLRLSSLIELARVLGLELTLVPRKMLPAIKSIARGSFSPPKSEVRNDQSTIKELKRIQNTISQVTKANSTIKEFAQIERQFRDIQNFKVPGTALETIQNASKALQAYKFDADDLGSIHKILSEFQGVRNALAHSSITLPAIENVRSAYSLDDDDNG
ncbi:MAG: helix-turn-helix domain-containing protein [Acidiferrobacterales bacterium]